MDFFNRRTPGGHPQYDFHHDGHNGRTWRGSVVWLPKPEARDRGIPADAPGHRWGAQIHTTTATGRTRTEAAERCGRRFNAANPPTFEVR